MMVRATWAIPYKEYQDYSARPWPEMEKPVQAEKNPLDPDREAFEQVASLLNDLGVKVDKEVPGL